MKTKFRWLQATIDFAKTNELDMPWANAGNRRDWAERCSTRANLDR